MNINNRVIAFIYRFSAFVLGVTALVYDFGIFDGEFRKVNFLYFTILSNLLCMVLFFVLIIRTIIDIRRKGIYGSSSISPHIKGSIMISIILTMTVYHFILIPYALKIDPYQQLKITDIIFHYVIPFLTVFDWILFDEKRSFSWYDPILWTIVPYLYAAFVFLQSRVDIADRINNHMNRYIYVFLDVNLLGNMRVAFNIISLSFAFVVLGYGVFLLDKIKIKSRV